ncbi:MAG TPA: bifunctional sulfate adenylyltransferase/adenylylsulfate kinase [Gammaproteobacteria bacterium]|nr:bifunctional sulfate adenylyltransferase/adenylylsulfate kinase [Gammaproteobacteria bacterium]
MSAGLIPPHGGTLVNRIASSAKAEELRAKAADLPKITLSAKQACDLEMIAIGAFSPLTGFVKKADFESICRDMRLAGSGGGTVWPIPITLAVDDAVKATLKTGSQAALHHADGTLLAVMDVEEIYPHDKKLEISNVFRTEDEAHPGVKSVVDEGDWLVGGPVHVITVTPEKEPGEQFTEFRLPPAATRDAFTQRGWRTVAAFQTRNPIHRAHEYLCKCAQEICDGLLIHPLVGETKPGDIPADVRMKCYEVLIEKYFVPERTLLSVMPAAMRYAGPREAILHALVRKNYGCTHFIVGRDHAGPGNDSKGKPFYGPYDAQALMKKHAGELDITMVPFQNMVYVEDRAQYIPEDEVKEGQNVLNISGTEFRRRLQEGLDIPDWFSYPAVVDELRKTHPPRHRQGFTVFFTGLSGSGKSTIANALMVKLMELGGRRVTLLDGDVVRKHLSSELGFTREHRDINILRIGFVASEITKNGGIAICAPIAPYVQTRRQVAEMIRPLGGYLEIHVATPLEVCEQRDRKGLYAKARAGIIKEFTGISDPYDVPQSPDMSIDTQIISPDNAAHRIIVKLESMGFVR